MSWGASLSKVTELLSRPGLKRVSQELVGAIEPSIGIGTSAVDEKVQSDGRFGGEVWAPKNFEWPTVEGRNLSAIAQISLAELPPTSIASRLPSEGFLTFFVEMSGDPYDPRSCSVHCFRDKPNQLVKQDPRHPKRSRWWFWENPIKEVCLSFEPDWTLPDPSTAFICSLQLTEEEEDLYYEAWNPDRSPFEVYHRLFGHPVSFQNDVWKDFLDVVGAGESEKDWVFLFQLDSDWDLNYPFDVTGAYYFFIPEEDLKQHRFDRVRFISQVS